MKSHKTSITKSGSLLIELSIAVAIASISVSALAFLVYSKQDYALNLSQKFTNIFSAISTLETMRGEDYLISKGTIITPCLKRLDQPPFSLFIADLVYAKALDGDCEGTLFLTNISSSTVFTQSKTNIEGTTTTLDALSHASIVSSYLNGSSTITEISQIDNSSHDLKLSGTITDLDATQKNIFLTTDDSHSQVKIIARQTPLTLSNELTLPGVTGSYPGAISIFYADNKLYVGTHRTAGNEFHIFDVSHSASQWLGSIELNHNINSIIVRGNFAYLATSGNTKNLIVLDISNPKNIKMVSSLALPGTEDSLSEFLIGNSLYLGRKKSLRNTDPDFSIIDISSTTNPTLLSSKIFQKDITAIKVINNLAFIATNDTTHAVEIINVSDPKNISAITTIPFSEKIESIDIDYGYLFVLTNHELIKIKL